MRPSHLQDVTLNTIFFGGLDPRNENVFAATCFEFAEPGKIWTDERKQRANVAARVGQGNVSEVRSARSMGGGGVLVGLAESDGGHGGWR